MKGKIYKSLNETSSERDLDGKLLLTLLALVEKQKVNKVLSVALVFRLKIKTDFPEELRNPIP